MANVGSAAFEPWRGGAGDVGSASFQSWVAAGSGSEHTVAFQSWTAFGVGVETSNGTGALSLQEWTATGEARERNSGTGAATFESWTAVGGLPARAAASFESWAASGIVRGQNVAAASFEAWRSRHSGAYASFEKMVVVAAGSMVLPSTYAAKVINTKNGGVTEYTNHNFNSFARIGGSWYGAGPSGLVRLDGTTDNGANIDWAVRTGQHDGGAVELKRLPEVVLGLRASGKVRVRVHPSDTEHHDYMLPVVQTDTIHQHRVLPGKGMRGRWFSVELQGADNSDLELDSMQINMTKTTRRLG